MNIKKDFSPVNFTAGRAGQKVQFIVFHTMVGSFSGSKSWMRNALAGTVAHYAVALDGYREQWCDENNTAWHAANWPINLKSIGIEHEDKTNWRDSARTDALYNASIELAADICRRHGITPSRDTFLLHKNVAQKHTDCPGGLDVDRIINGVKALLAPKPAPAPAPAPAPQAVNIKYVKFSEPRRMRVKKDGGAEVWDFNVGDWNQFKSVMHKAQGDEFIAVGQAEHPLGGIYYMTGFSWNNANRQEAVPFRTAGMNISDLEGWPAEQSAPAPAAPAATPEPVIPPVAPEPAPAPDWRTTFTEGAGTYRAAETITVADLAGEMPEIKLLKGQLVRKAGTFDKDGVRYFRTAKSVENDVWYGIPASNLVPAPDPNQYVGPLMQDIKPVAPAQDAAATTAEEDDDALLDLSEINLSDEAKEFAKNLSTREKLVVFVAQAQMVFIKFFTWIAPWKRNKKA